MRTAHPRCGELDPRPRGGRLPCGAIYPSGGAHGSCRDARMPRVPWAPRHRLSVQCGQHVPERARNFSPRRRHEPARDTRGAPLRRPRPRRGRARLARPTASKCWPTLALLSGLGVLVGSGSTSPRSCADSNCLSRSFAIWRLSVSSDRRRCRPSSGTACGTSRLAGTGPSPRTAGSPRRGSAFRRS